MVDLPPWFWRSRKQVYLTARAIAKVNEAAKREGVTFSTALDALVRLAPADRLKEQLDSDAGTVASWRLHGDDPA